jgi:hypothetical protein
VQIRKSSDSRVNALAEHIEFIQDRKYYIRPFEMAELIIEFLDNLSGQAYAEKIRRASDDHRSLTGNNKV